MKLIPRISINLLVLIAIVIAKENSLGSVADFIAYGCLGYMSGKLSDYISKRWLD